VSAPRCESSAPASDCVRQSLIFVSLFWIIIVIVDDMHVSCSTLLNSEECALLEERERNIDISIVNMLSSLAVDFSPFYSHCFCNRLHSAKVDILRRTET